MKKLSYSLTLVLITFTVFSLSQAQDQSPEQLWQGAMDLFAQSRQVQAGTETIQMEMTNGEGEAQFSLNMKRTASLDENGELQVETEGGPQGGFAGGAGGAGGAGQAGDAGQQAQGGQGQQGQGRQGGQGGQGGRPAGGAGGRAGLLRGAGGTGGTGQDVFAREISGLELTPTGETRRMRGKETVEISYNSPTVSGNAFFDIATGAPVRVLSVWAASERQLPESDETVTVPERTIEILYTLTEDGLLAPQVTQSESIVEAGQQGRARFFGGNAEGGTMRTTVRSSDYFINPNINLDTP